jgi:large subunit ribosomal protein L10
MDRIEKEQRAQDLQTRLGDCSAMVLMGFGGLTVAEVDDLRGKFRDAGCSYNVYKNSTIRFAVEGTSLEAGKPLLKGMTGLAFNSEDPGAPARVARDFAKDNDKLVIKGGVMEGTLLDVAGVQALADMPGPNELKAQLLALLNTPATNMVRVLNAGAQNLLNVLNARKDQLEGEAA